MPFLHQKWFLLEGDPADNTLSNTIILDFEKRINSKFTLFVTRYAEVFGLFSVDNNNR